MRVAIIGSRTFEDFDRFDSELRNILGNERVVVISGGAKGADSMAQKWANQDGLDFILYKPYHLIDNKVEFQPRFFFSRNRQIVDNCDMLIAFWDGESRGTAHAIEFAKKRGKELHVIEV